MKPPAITVQLGYHDQQMMKAAGVTPIESGIKPHWKELQPACTGANMRPDILEQLKQPNTFAFLEGLARKPGYLWWDGEAWVWEWWYWRRWPVQRVRVTIADVAQSVSGLLNP